MKKVIVMLACVFCFMSIYGCGRTTEAHEDISQLKYEPAEEIIVSDAPSEVTHTYESNEESSLYVNDASEYSQVIDRVINEYNFEPIAWNNTIDWKEDADVLIKMAEDTKGRYKIYGIISKEEGAYGMVMIDNVDFTEFHTNYVYEKWFYTGNSVGEPKLNWDKSKLYFTYPVPSNTTYTTKTVQIDCGYDSGYMGFVNE